MNLTFPIGCLAFFFSLFASDQAIAQAQAQQFYDNKPLLFTENKGQWTGDFLFKTDMGGGAAFLKRTGFMFVLQDKADRDRLKDKIHGHVHDTTYSVDPSGRTAFKNNAAAAATETTATGTIPDVKGHAYEVTFVNASANPEVVPDKAADSYANYLIGNDPSKWRSGVKSYQLVNYKSLYPGIDMQVYSESSVLKYDLIVQAGADPSLIQLEYTGVDKMEIKKEQLIITTSVGTITEQMPFAYQYIDNERVSVKVSYSLSGNKLRFKVSGKYNDAYPLVIDPSYVFSTVSGSTADNWGFTATYDAQGCFYGGGIVFNVGYPVTTGALQTTYGGGTFDIGISKFASNGRSLIYATYLGGNGLEQPHSLFVDPSGNLVISGRTTSSNYPGTIVGTRGGWDIAITKLNASGSGIIGSLIIASPEDEGVNINENRQTGTSILLRNYGDDARSEVVIDATGNIYVASCTRSANFPVTAGVFQPNSGGSQDGVVMKINQDCNTLLWASYLGGSKEDAAYVLALDGTSSLYVAGGTASNNFPMRGTPLFGTYRGGVCDGFIAHITADGKTLQQSTYMGAGTMTAGAAAADQVYGIQLDSKGFVYIMGTTEGSWPTMQPTGTATFYNDNSKQFIAKLKPDLSAFVYSTTFGKVASTPSISPVAFLVDRCENVYVSGWGGGINTSLHYANSNTTGLRVKNALQSSTDSQDFYFFVLQRDATDVLFASYFGGNGTYEHVDGGTSRFDRNGVIYQAICAWCPTNPDFRPRYPTTPGAYSSTAPPECNLGALKIAFNLDGVKAGIKTLERKTNYCVPATITFVDTTTSKALTWTWDFGDGSPQVTNTNDTITHTYSLSGNYTVTLIKCDPASCNGCDTARLVLRIRTDEAKFNMTAVRQPPCESLSYLFDLVSAPPKPYASNSFVLDFGDNTPAVSVGPANFPYTHQFQVEGVYNVTLTLVDSNYCNAPEVDTVTLRVAANVRASFVAPDSSCVPATITFENTSKGGETFTWDFGDGIGTSTDISPTYTYNTPGAYIVKLHAEDQSTCNKQHDTAMTINVFAPPTADFTYSPVKPTENTPVTFANQSSTDAVTFVWEFGDGNGSSDVNPVYQYNKTGIYDVYLIATNRTGCTDTVHKQVSAIIIPLFDIPSAFSPNRDGVNDVFLVKGFGIAKFNMKVYNRWGQLMFETNSPSIGWDGTFKGNLQPMDVYAFVINLEFSDGTTASKNGSVTLLR
ncbi:gliding motility-associated C-terminal domain-containing protein [Chitinophaga sp. CF118]|uniref:gliding motility-associated C-terminal domain-containing protein n=1 Tax=Chitinophaga sp. CF118 TaxID=1884367 RepID=UPI0008E73467|nr:PKD domain-containing protein [Chitinophaga sp. CF118]SFD11560.1 gliding motility-associated C-terminal domain-containing protein [Chitinophaga sp. CF118]